MLSIEALAEGVEALSEHAKLAQISRQNIQVLQLVKPTPI
jgi:hypothetical protein